MGDLKMLLGYTHEGTRTSALNANAWWQQQQEEVIQPEGEDEEQEDERGIPPHQSEDITI